MLHLKQFMSLFYLFFLKKKSGCNSQKRIQALLDWLEMNPTLKGMVVNLHPADAIAVQEALGKGVGSGVGTASKVWVARENLTVTNFFCIMA